MRLERELLTEEVNVFCVQLLGTAKWQAYVQILQIWMLYTIKELPLTQSWPCTHGLLSSTQQVQALLLAVASATVRLQHCSPHVSILSLFILPTPCVP
jgi:hypothetical protein